MLPYTTYNIPESPEKTPPVSDKWLWIVTDQNCTDQDNELLEKIAAALNADFLQNAYCHQISSDQPLSLADIKGAKPRLIISFGVFPAALGLWVDLKKSGYLTMEGFTFILTSSLEKLAGSNSDKKELWQAMQLFMEKH